MARKKKQLDKLSLDMIECEKAGFGCHYGAWKATQKPVEIVKKDIPDSWLVCAYCGMPFKPTTKRKQFYCGATCQHQAAYERLKKKKEGANNDEA